MIAIASQTYDLEGARVFAESDPATDLRNLAMSRRVSRTPTLDGGCAVYDAGLSHSDRDVTLAVQKPSPDDLDFCRYIAETYNLVVVTIEDGAYLAIPEGVSIATEGALEMRLLLTEKLSA